MSGYLLYSNYGDDDEPQIKRKVTPPSVATTTPNQMNQMNQMSQPKRILRTNQRTLRSKPQTQTQGPQPQQHRYVQELIQKIHSYEDGGTSDSDSDNNYAPNAAAIQQQFQTDAVPNRNRFAGASGTDLNARLNPAPAKEAFSLHSANQQHKQYMPSVFQASSNETDVANKDVLLQKLDHIISLLEDQRDEKTGHVTEELVLYCFLGVFIIFIVDSFARAGKYVR